MFERETKREKILEARQREIRLKERSRSQQSREDEPAQDDGTDSPDQLIARAERDFFRIVETELQGQSRSDLSDDPSPDSRLHTGNKDGFFFCFIRRRMCEEEDVKEAPNAATLADDGPTSSPDSEVLCD